MNFIFERFTIHAHKISIWDEYELYLKYNYLSSHIISRSQTNICSTPSLILIFIIRNGKTHRFSKQELGLAFNFTVWGTWLAYATFTEDNDGWDLTALDVRTAASSLLIFNEITPTNWTADVQLYPVSTAVIVSGVFTRAGNYYVLNLFFPLLVIVFVANATIFISADETDKAELQVWVIYHSSIVFNNSI